MANFKLSKERSRNKRVPPKRDYQNKDNFKNRRGSGDRRNVELTEVTCSSCGVKCEVPFKPTSNKPLFCSKCFEKKENGGKSNKGGVSNKDIQIINEKLDKIMKSLNID